MQITMENADNYGKMQITMENADNENREISEIGRRSM